MTGKLVADQADNVVAYSLIMLALGFSEAVDRAVGPLAFPGYLGLFAVSGSVFVLSGFWLCGAQIKRVHDFIDGLIPVDAGLQAGYHWIAKNSGLPYQNSVVKLRAVFFLVALQLVVVLTVSIYRDPIDYRFLTFSMMFSSTYLSIFLVIIPGSFLGRHLAQRNQATPSNS